MKDYFSRSHKSMLKFYLDESAHVGIAIALQSFGFTVVTVKDAHKRGLPDEGQLLFAQSIHAILITNDVDFCTLGKRHHHDGIIFILPKKRRLGEIIHKIVGLAECVDDFKDTLFYV